MPEGDLWPHECQRTCQDLRPQQDFEPPNHFTRHLASRSRSLNSTQLSTHTRRLHQINSQHQASTPSLEPRKDQEIYQHCRQSNRSEQGLWCANKAPQSHSNRRFVRASRDESSRSSFSEQGSQEVTVLPDAQASRTDAVSSFETSCGNLSSTEAFGICGPVFADVVAGNESGRRTETAEEPSSSSRRFHSDSSTVAQDTGSYTAQDFVGVGSALFQGNPRSSCSVSRFSSVPNEIRISRQIGQESRGEPVLQALHSPRSSPASGEIERSRFDHSRSFGSHIPTNSTSVLGRSSSIEAPGPQSSTTPSLIHTQPLSSILMGVSDDAMYVTVCSSCGVTHVPQWALGLLNATCLCKMFSPVSDRRLQSRLSVLRKCLAVLHTMCPYPDDDDFYPLLLPPDLLPTPPRTPPSSTSTQGSLPLDPIEVDAIDIKGTLRLFPELASVFQLIDLPEAFNALWLADSTPQPTIDHHRNHLPSSESLTQLVQWGILAPVQPEQVKFFVSCFTVPKAAKGTSRFILNASKLNEMQFRPPHYALPSLEYMKKSIFSHGYAVKTDLRHAFYQFPLHPEVSLFFGLFFPGVGYFVVRRLPMGWSFAPYICQSFAEALVGLPQIGMGIPLIDDYLSLGKRPGDAMAHATCIRNAICVVGGSVNDSKSDETESTTVEFNGVEWDLLSKGHRLCEQFVKKWSNWLQVASNVPFLPVRAWIATISACLYAIRILQLPQCDYFHLFRWASSISKAISAGSCDWHSIKAPWSTVRVEMRLVAGHVQQNHWVQYFPLVAAPALIYSDASLTGWCFTLSNFSDPTNPFFVRYGRTRPNVHINILEALAVYRALEYVCPLYPGTHWRIACDNSSVVSHVNRMRGSSFHSNYIVQKISQVLTLNNCTVHLFWIPTHEQVADRWTRLDL